MSFTCQIGAQVVLVQTDAMIRTVVRVTDRIRVVSLIHSKNAHDPNILGRVGVARR